MATLVIDIDGVVCRDTGRHDDYKDREPLGVGIAMVRKHYADGHEVIFHTARWKADRRVTARWLKKHAVPYHKLLLGKPRGDVYIDDRAVRWPCSPGDMWRAVHTGGGPMGQVGPRPRRAAVARLQGHIGGAVDPTAAPDPTADPTQE